MGPDPAPGPAPAGRRPGYAPHVTDRSGLELLPAALRTGGVDADRGELADACHPLPIDDLLRHQGEEAEAPPEAGG